MRTTDEYIIRIKKAVNNIYPLRNECWAELTPLIYIKEFSKDDFFSKEGQLLRELGFVLSGILRIYYLDGDGKEWNKHFLRKNDFVASGISPHTKSITNIQALTKAEILCLPYFEFSKLAKKYNEINSFIQKLTFSYLERKQDREINLLTEKTIDNYLAFKKIYPDLEHQIQHYHIASYLGITPTQLSRLRKKLNPHQHM